MFRISKIVKSH
jgi:serine/threonine protein kinase